MAQRAEERSALVYDALDRNAGFYQAHALPEHRSVMNATFRIADPALEAAFVEQARARNMIGLKGHKVVGGIRASLYNGMPLEGAQALAAFMDEFARSHG